MHLLLGLFCFNLSEKQLHSELFIGIKFEILQVLYIPVEQEPDIFRVLHYRELLECEITLNPAKIKFNIASEQ